METRLLESKPQRTFRDPRFVAGPGKRTRINDLLARQWDAALLYRVLLPKESGGLEGTLYVCGQAGFAKAVLDALKALIEKLHISIPGSTDPRPDQVRFRNVPDQIHLVQRPKLEKDKDRSPSRRMQLLS